MGLFSMIGDVIGSLHDMKELGKIQDVIENAVEALIASGKCPEQLKTAFEATKNVSKDASATESMGKMKDFAKALSDHIDVLPEDIRKKVEKYADVVKDLEDRAEDIQELTGKK